MKFNFHPNYQNGTSYFNWTFFSWKGEDDEECNIPGCIFSFVTLNDDDTKKMK